MRRAAILLTCLAIFFTGCQYFFDDDDRRRKNRPGQGGDPDASCGDGHGDADGGLVPDGGDWPPWPDAGESWPDAGSTAPDASPDW